MKTDLLEWWAAHEIDFPALSVMARQYLGVPATSASAERLFSIAGCVPHQPSLTLGAARALLYCASRRLRCGSRRVRALADCIAVGRRAYDDLRQHMKEEMLEILMWARVNREKRQQHRRP